MTETSTGIYRTVVRTEFLEDSKETYWTYEGDEYKRVEKPVHAAGSVMVEVFGPYANKAQNQNYSQLTGYRKEDTGEKLYERNQFQYMSDATWNSSYYTTATKVNYISTTKVTAEKQTLAPVFALQPNGSLTMELDWVKYDN
jgi:hypothetical protein